jgi:hypothetical protein
VLNQTGTLSSSTFLGGSDQDGGESIAVDFAGTIYVTGRTQSNDFPTALPFQPSRRGVFDAFVTKLRLGSPSVIAFFELPRRQRQRRRL